VCASFNTRLKVWLVFDSQLQGKALGYPQEVIFDGRAAGIPFSVFNRFSKVFTTVPETGEVFGRTLLGAGTPISPKVILPSSVCTPNAIARGEAKIETPPPKT
jgi:hypothetical protein